MKKIYNGTSHEINFYAPGNLACTRDGRFFRPNAYTFPARTLPQAQPLSIQFKQHAPYTAHPLSANPCCFLSNTATAQADFLSDYINYDVIIVSSLFAKAVQQNLFSLFEDFPHVEYIDRLFTIVPVYESTPLKGQPTPKVIGAAGIEKVLLFRSPLDYQKLLCNNVPVSASAVEACIKYCDVMGQRYSIFKGMAQYTE